jgi:hypothetical protein
MGTDPKLRPFWGHLSGSATFPKTDDCLEISGQPFRTVGTAEGGVAPLGPSTLRSAHCVTEDGRALEGKLTLMSENGDHVHLSYTGFMVEPPPLIVQQIELIIDGGTGRFAGASGQALGMVYVTFMGYDESEWPMELALAGTIAC